MKKTVSESQGGKKIGITTCIEHASDNRKDLEMVYVADLFLPRRQSRRVKVS